MKIAMTSLAALLLMTGIASAADEATNPSDVPTPGREAGQQTSDRSPELDTVVPLSQTTNVDGETSDRSPAGDRQSDN